jgi:hypothetical protein
METLRGGGIHVVWKHIQWHLADMMIYLPSRSEQLIRVDRTRETGFSILYQKIDLENCLLYWGLD